MSDRDHVLVPSTDTESTGVQPAEPVEARTEPSPERRGGAGWGVAGIALATLLLVIGFVATGPRWAPLLPWGATADDAAQRALAVRVDRLEAAQQEAAQRLQQQQEQLRQQLQQATAETKSAVQRLTQRIETLEAKPAGPPAGETAELRQQTAKLSQNASELTARLEALEKGLRERTAHDTADAALVMGLLQIRDAVQAGRPFAAEYEAFAVLARSGPEIVEAAAPLAEPAKTGVASPAVLGKRLHELAGNIAAAGAPAAPVEPAGWGDSALARLRGLVTIRRVDGARPEGTDAAVNAAELALAGGDLAAAVSVLDELTGAPAEAAAPWLRMARQRLAVDAALRRLEALLTARLGSPASGPGSSG